jgi:hypothetical protein
MDWLWAVDVSIPLLWTGCENRTYEDMISSLTGVDKEVRSVPYVEGRVFLHA